MLEERESKVKVVFIQGRPSGHPIHMEYAKLLKSDFHFEDHYLQWQDKRHSFKVTRYLSWLLNAFFFPNKNKYDVFFCECLRVPPLIMRKLGLIRPHQKLIALMADESLYFLDKGKYSWLTAKLIRSFLNNCDAIFCIGDLQYVLAMKYTRSASHHKIIKIYNGIDNDLQSKLNSISRAKEDTIRLVVIANLSAAWRSWYKGVDIAIAAFIKTIRVNNCVELNIIGDVNDIVKAELLKDISKEHLSAIKFLGLVESIENVLDKFDLCIHVSRGDAFPTSTIECLSAGIPVVISKDTGTKGIVESIDKKLVVDVDVDQTYLAIMHYIGLAPSAKLEMRNKFKQATKEFNTEVSNRRFKELFYSKLGDLGLKV